MPRYLFRVRGEAQPCPDVWHPSAAFLDGLRKPLMAFVREDAEGLAADVMACERTEAQALRLLLTWVDVHQSQLWPSPPWPEFHAAAQSLYTDAGLLFSDLMTAERRYDDETFWLMRDAAADAFRDGATRQDAGSAMVAVARGRKRQLSLADIRRAFEMGQTKARQVRSGR